MCDKLEFVIIVNRCHLEFFELSALYEFMQFNGDISIPTTRVAEFWKFFGITKSIIYLLSNTYKTNLDNSKKNIKKILTKNFQLLTTCSIFAEVKTNH